MIKRLLLSLVLCFGFFISKAQCPQLYDYLGNLSSNPRWINCTGGSFNLNFQSNVNFGAYTINWGDGTPNTTGASYTAGTSAVSHQYAATIDTFVVTLTLNAGCTVTGLVVMEKPVNASIQIPIGGVTTTCAPKMLQFMNSSTDASETTVFTWNFGDGTAPVVYTYTNAGQVVTHTYNKGTVNCQTQVTLSARNYCSFQTPTIANFNPIQVYDIDDATIAASATTKCYPDTTFSFTNTTTRNCVGQGNTFQRQERWNLGDYWGLGHDSIVGWRPWPPSAALNVAYPGVGTYSILLLDSNLCGIDSQRVVVNIVNPPTAGIIGPVGPLCSGATATFTNTSSTGYSYRWNYGEGGGFVNGGFGPQSHTYNTAGTYTISVVAYINGAGNTCTDTASTVITILPRPTASFTFGPTSGCNQLANVTFTDNSNSAAAWQWNFGNGNVFSGQNPPPQYYGNVGNFTVSLTVTALNTCTNTYTNVVRVYQTPSAILSQFANCVSIPATYTNSSTALANDPIISWTWDFGDGTPTVSAQSPSHTYNVPATYNIKLVVATAHCKDSTQNIAQINLKPAANFTYAPINGCTPLAVTFTNTSQNGISYSWNFGNGATSTAVNPSAVFTNTTGANVTYTVGLVAMTGVGCKDSIKKVVDVYFRPKASYTVTAVPACEYVVATFTNTSVGGASYQWNFGDTTAISTATNPIHTYHNGSLYLQTYTVQMVSTSFNGCKDTTTGTVIVYPKPSFTFTMLPSSGCSPLSVSFPPVLGAVTYQWNFGDGNTATGPNPIHTYYNSGQSDLTYTVSLIATNAFTCADTAYGYPIVYAKPIANFLLSPTSGCTPVVVTFTNTSSVASIYNWTFGDGVTSTALNPTHTYTNSSTSSSQSYTCTLIGTSNHGCSDTLSQSVMVFPTVKASFIADTPGCSPAVISFTNTSQGASLYSWDLGNGTTSGSPNPSVNYLSGLGVSQTYTVELLATTINNCKDSVTMPVTIYPKPVFNITAQPDTGCTPLTVNFPAINGAASYQWIFGDGSGGVSGNVSHDYFNVTLNPVTYTIQLMAADIHGCKDTATTTVYVYPKPTAFFQVSATTIYIPNSSVDYTNLSSGAINYHWEFGDGDTSNVVNPQHYYQSPGNFTNSLIVTSLYGCKDTFDLPTQIIAILDGDIKVPNAFTPNPNGGNGGGFGNGDLNNDVFHPVIRGVDKYVMTIYSRWGELLFESRDVNIGWDGYYRGKLCTQDVYVWKIVANTLDGKDINKTGDVLLLR